STPSATTLAFATKSAAARPAASPAARLTVADGDSLLRCARGAAARIGAPSLSVRPATAAEPAAAVTATAAEQIRRHRLIQCGKDVSRRPESERSRRYTKDVGL